MVQRIVQFSALRPGERFASSQTGVVYEKIDETFGQEERGDKFELFGPDNLVYTDLPHFGGCFTFDPLCLTADETPIRLREDQLC